MLPITIAQRAGLRFSEQRVDAESSTASITLSRLTSYQITSVHGLDTTGRPRSARHTETYGNTESCTGQLSGLCDLPRVAAPGLSGSTTAASTPAQAIGIRSSTSPSIVSSLPITPSDSAGGLSSLDPFDTVDNNVYYSGTMSASGLTMTDGSKNFPNLTPNGAPYSVYDTTQGFVSQIVSNTSTSITVMGNIPESNWSGFNSGDNYEIIRATVCMDQAGRGQGNYISGYTPTPAAPIHEALDPIYEWNDAFPIGTLSQQVLDNAKQTIANRDYYTDNWKGGGLSGPMEQTSPTTPFNGTTACDAGSDTYSCGVGIGILANRPTSCTPGVAYWATDQGNWNTSGNAFGQGVLYKCTTTNNWASSYQPYTYPHPLVSGNNTTTSAGPPAPPQNLVSTVM